MDMEGGKQANRQFQHAVLVLQNEYIWIIRAYEMHKIV